jgi:hypothetical protein
MKLQEILNLADQSLYIPFEEIHMRKNQLKVFYKNYYSSKVYLIIWNVTNTGGATTISPENEIDQAIEEVLNNYYSYLNEEEREEQKELIYSNLQTL